MSRTRARPGHCAGGHERTEAAHLLFQIRHALCRCFELWEEAPEIHLKSVILIHHLVGLELECRVRRIEARTTVLQEGQQFILTHLAGQLVWRAPSTNNSRACGKKVAEPLVAIHTLLRDERVELADIASQQWKSHVLHGLVVESSMQFAVKHGLLLSTVVPARGHSEGSSPGVGFITTRLVLEMVIECARKVVQLISKGG